MKNALIGILILIVGFLIITVCYFGGGRLTEDIFTVAIDGINVDRYENMLVMYTEDLDRNRYGWELLVESESNYVIDSGVYVDFREGTYILSGHGAAADILARVELGDIVKLGRDNESVTLSRDLGRSTLKRLELEDGRVNELLEARREGLYDVDLSGVSELDAALEEKLSAIRRCLWSLDVDAEEISRLSDEAMDIIDEKYYLTLESSVLEARGMWHRPNATGIDESTLEGVRTLASSLSELGINVLYVETLWHGMTTYYSDLLGTQHPQMAGNDYGEYGDDYMLALISECHLRGIEVHAWVELLSPDSPDGNLQPYLSESWLCSDSEGSAFLDPAIPEVGEFLAEVLCEMVEKYDFDGVSYDYIRYSDTGTTALCVEGESVEDFEQDAITALVGRLSESLLTVDPTLVISASPYGYIDDAREIYMQDTVEWIENGYIDVVLPMIYTENANLLVETAEEYCEYSDMVLQYTGISPLYNGASIRTNQELTSELRELGVAGVSLFASQNYITYDPDRAAEISAVLSKTTGSRRAVTPTSDVNVVLSAWRDQVEDRFERIYSPRMNEVEREVLIAMLDSLPTDMQDPCDIADVLVALEKMREAISDFDDPAVRERLTEQIDHLSRIFDAAITRYLIHYGYWTPSTEPDRPSVYEFDFSCGVAKKS